MKWGQRKVQLTFYLTGDIPTDYKVNSATACQLSLLDACESFLNIHILKCKGQGGKSKDFFVYYLKSTISVGAGYCFGK